MDPKWAKTWAVIARITVAISAIIAGAAMSYTPSRDLTTIVPAVLVGAISAALAVLSGRWVNPSLTDFVPVTVESPLRTSSAWTQRTPLKPTITRNSGQQVISHMSGQTERSLL